MQEAHEANECGPRVTGPAMRPVGLQRTPSAATCSYPTRDREWERCRVRALPEEIVVGDEERLSLLRVHLGDFGQAFEVGFPVDAGGEEDEERGRKF